MNSEAILALISELYATIAQKNEEIKQLKAALGLQDKDPPAPEQSNEPEEHV